MPSYASDTRERITTRRERSSTSSEPMALKPIINYEVRNEVSVFL